MNNTQLLTVSDLKDHPINKEIYGNVKDDDEWNDFVESIKRHGVLDAIYVDENYVILSGHRRVEACKMLDIKTIPGNVVKLKDESQKIAFLLEKNRYRSKTNTQRIREAKTYEANISLMAEANMKHKNVEEVTKIVTRDALGKIAGMSGSSFQRGSKVIEKIDALNAEGKHSEAVELENILNASISGASDKIVKKAKPTPPPDPNYWYKDYLENLCNSMIKISNKMLSKRRSNSPSSLSWFIEGIRDDIEKYKTWLDVENGNDCPICKGTMFIDGEDCRHCINGKVGYYKIKDMDIPE